MSEQVTISALQSLALLLISSAVLAEPEQNAPQQYQVESVERSVQSYVYPDPDIPTIEDAPGYKLRQLDKKEQQFAYQLWQLLSDGYYSRARSMIDKRVKSEPNWKPDAHLLHELKRGEIGRKIDTARNEPATFIALSKRYPERFSCYEYYNLWSLADAYVTAGERATAPIIDRQVIDTCSSREVLLKTLDRIAAREGPDAALAILSDLSAQSDSRISSDTVQQRRYTWTVNQAARLREQGEVKASLALLKPLEPSVISKRDAATARMLAWNYHDTGDSAAASNWFVAVADWSGSDDDRLALLQQRWRSGQHDQVLEWLMLKPPTTGRAAAWSANILRSEAASRYNKEHYAVTLNYLDRALAYLRPEPTDSAILRGWASYHLEQYHRAYDAFAEAYGRGDMNTEQSRSVSAALLYTTRHTGEWLRLKVLADTYSGPLLAEREERKLLHRLISAKLSSSQVRVDNGHLVRTYHGSIDSVVSAGFGVHSKRGLGGNDRIVLLQQPLLAAEWSTGLGEIYAQANRFTLDSGSIGSGTWLGSGQWGVDTPLRNGTFESSGMGEVLVGIKPHDSPLYVEAGRTAEGSATDSTWMGQLQYAQKMLQGEYTLSLYRRPRRDSMLAYVGMEDPFSDKTWGRVMEQGVAVDGYSELSDKWKLGTHLAAFALSGEGVEDNSGGEVYLSLQQPLYTGSHTLFEAGPYLYATSYRKNLNHFTLGHGGYFSPQRLIQPGISSLWQYRSPELIYRLRFSVGYQIQHDDAVARYPLQDDGSSWVSANNSGYTGDIRLSWVKQLGKTSWQWSGQLHAAEGPDNGQRDAWLFLRYNFNGRSETRYDDLPERMMPSLPRIP